MGAPRDEIVRIGITKNGGQPSSISMDLYLAEALIKKVGGEKEMAQWVQKVVSDLEREDNANALGTAIGTQTHAKSGLSRRVQRATLRYVLEGVN